MQKSYLSVYFRSLFTEVPVARNISCFVNDFRFCTYELYNIYVYIHVCNQQKVTTSLSSSRLFNGLRSRVNLSTILSHVSSSLNRFLCGDIYGFRFTIHSLPFNLTGEILLRRARIILSRSNLTTSSWDNENDEDNELRVLGLRVCRLSLPDSCLFLQTRYIIL